MIRIDRPRSYDVNNKRLESKYISCSVILASICFSKYYSKRFTHRCHFRRCICDIFSSVLAHFWANISIPTEIRNAMWVKWVADLWVANTTFPIFSTCNHKKFRTYQEIFALMTHCWVIDTNVFKFTGLNFKLWMFADSVFVSFSEFAQSIGSRLKADKST